MQKTDTHENMRKCFVFMTSRSLFKSRAMADCWVYFLLQSPSSEVSFNYTIQIYVLLNRLLTYINIQSSKLLSGDLTAAVVFPFRETSCIIRISVPGAKSATEFHNFRISLNMHWFSQFYPELSILSNTAIINDFTTHRISYRIVSV